MEEGEDSKVVAAPKARKRKVKIAYNSDNSDMEKKKSKSAKENYL